MDTARNTIADSCVYPIKVKYRGKTHLTFSYYTEIDEAIFCGKQRLIFFDSYDALFRFCSENALTIQGEIACFDFDLPIINPVDYRVILNNWNLMSTISNVLEMYFEGNAAKYNRLYKQLFYYNMSTVPLPERISLSDKMFQQLLRVFKRKNRLLEKWIEYTLVERELQ